MPQMRFLALILAALAAFLALPAAAQDFPARPEGPVLDQANVLPPAEEAALDAKLRAYNQQTGRAVIVATVNSLDGLDPESYARGLAEKWGVGGAETEEGVLMLVAPNEREVWISTARGVQARLTDVSAGRIVRNTIIPAFKNGDMPGGIAAGADAIMERLSMDPAQAAAIEEAEAAAAKAGNGSERSAGIGGVIFWMVLIIFFAVIFGRGGRGRRRHGVASSVGNVILWSAIGSAMGGHRSGGGGFGGGGGGGFGGFGGGGGGFNGGGAGGSW
ncbi:conserved hypothetical protein [Altererythrobacter sp. B11]|uniref:TPM domain-containing protein n=1 Tax=Altererythrobacter sp. B11 TaxID=2060312 RepID=UPI000DC6E87F|nr:TPM domain-containing protein [Altererythrobacter sp. B11]BBC73882.1 conserved hypothetical protein [Altererythrobacter sp. B11]